jgi:hypothetical protein
MLKYKTMSSPLKILEVAVQNGYLLHGSQFRLTEVKPRKANDRDKISGNQLAVYATNNVRIAVVNAFFHRTKRDSLSGYSGEGNGPLRVYGKNITFRPGHVHILPAGTFVHSEDDEFVSLVPVTPVGVVHVEPKILVPHLNLIVEFPW